MTKLLWQTEAEKRWRLDDGREVTVSNDYDQCLKCGRPLKSEFSRMVGRGHQCRNRYRSSTIIALAISPSNTACTRLETGAANADSESNPAVSSG